MATQVGAGYDAQIGTRASTSNPQVTEFYNKQTGAGFSDPNQLSSFVNQLNPNAGANASNVFGLVQQGYTPTVPVNVNPSTTTDTNVLSQTPKTAADFQALMYQQYQDQQAKQQQFQQQQAQAQQQYNQDYNTLQNFDVSLEGGISNIRNKPIALEFQQGQEAALQRNAAFTRSSLARTAQASAMNLQAVQDSYAQTLKAYELAQSFGSTSASLQLQIDAAKQKAEDTARQFAVDNNITKPFYAVGNTIFPTGGGAGFTSEQDFQTRTGMTVAQAEAKGMIQRDYGKTDSEWTQIGTDSYGSPIYGFVDPKTQTVTPYGSVTDSVSSDWQDGTQGGECGIFAHNLATFPPVGDTLQSKQAAVDKNGILADMWRTQGAQIGDVVIQNYGTTGHVSVVTGVNPDGTVTVKESNFNKDGKIGTRTIPMTDPHVYGVIRSQLKDSPTVDTNKPFYGLPKAVYDKAAAKADDFRLEPIVKNYNEVLNRYQTVQSVIDAGVGGPGDLAIIYEFMKALDPTSVVRESEYANAAKSGNIFMGALARFNGYFKESGGFLPDNVKQAFSDILDKKFEISNSQYQNLYNSYASQIDRITGKPKSGSTFLNDYAGALQLNDPLQQYIDGLSSNASDPLSSYLDNINSVIEQKQTPQTTAGGLNTGNSNALTVGLDEQGRLKPLF